MSTSTPTRRSTRNTNASVKLTSMLAPTPTTTRQSRKRSIGKVEDGNESSDLSELDDDDEEGEYEVEGSGVKEVAGLLTPPPTKERERKRRHVDVTLKKRGAPAPNPPFAPFPTPPQSREGDKTTRFQDVLPVASSSFQRPSTPPPRIKPFLPGQSIPSTPPRLRTQFQSIAGSPGKRRVTDPSGKSKLETLPGHLKTLVLLHSAFDLSLGLWLATHPPILPPLGPELEKAGSDGLDVDLLDLTNFLQIKGMIEKTCQRRFGITELRRLVWIWGWKGDEKALNDLEALERGVVEGPGNKTKAGDYLISLARTLDPVTGRRTLTHGIGLSLHLNQAEVITLRNSLHTQIGVNAGVMGGMGALGRWSAGGEDRGRRFEAKVWRWWEVCRERSARTRKGDAGSRGGDLEDDDGEDLVPNVPMAEIPKIPQPSMNIAPATAGSSSSRIGDPPIVRTGPLLPAFECPPSPRKPQPTSIHRPSSSTPGFGLFTPGRSWTLSSASGSNASVGAGGSDVFGQVEAIPSGSSSASIPGSGSSSGSRKGSVADRRQALYDRIKARTAKDEPSQPHSIGQLSLQAKLSNMTKSDAAAELKRRSTLSRLENVAEGVWMLFSSISSNVGLESSPGGLGGGLSNPLGKTRRRAFPMGQVVDIIVKSSKTPISAAEARDSLILLTTLCPSFLVLRLISRQEWLEMPAIQIAPKSPGVSTGMPSSPGRGDFSVRDVTGGGRLREVRERIRKELGE